MKQYLLYKEQIEGLRDVEETIKVVEKSAAARIHFLKKKVKNLFVYKKAIEDQLYRMTALGIRGKHPLLKHRTSGDRILVVLSGNEGMVGDLYHKLVNRFLQDAKQFDTIFVIGTKVTEYLDEEGVKSESLFLEDKNRDSIENIQQSTDILFHSFLEKNVQSIDVLYPSFISLGNQEMKIERFLPFDFSYQKEQKEEIREEANDQSGWPLFDPSHEQIFQKLLQRYVEIFFKEMVLDMKLSEYSARTVTAENAVHKTQEKGHTLMNAYRKERKKRITRKQMESFASLKKT